MRRFASWRWGLASLVLAFAGAAQPQADGRETVIAVIVSATAVETALNRAQIALIYRRKKTIWDNGERIVPLNLPADHALRQKFSAVVLRQSLEAQEEFWNQQYFQGVLPPHVLESERAVLRFVSATPNAVGYLGYCALDDSVRAVMLIANGRQINKAEADRHCN